jgi:hypothetical protein
MGISEKFQIFCNNIRLKKSVIETISYRYKRITKQLNIDFWGTYSDTNHSLYVGSYGRDTDIFASDVDILFRLPYNVYERINQHDGNGQSALLQEVRNSLQTTYKTSYIGGDGQVVKINFSDGVNFEIVPCFLNKNNSFTYPDSNDGGKWRVTDPKPEISSIKEKNKEYNGNLKNLCRMTRAWKATWEVPMGGLLIDTLAYNFLKNWEYRDESYLYYDFMTRDFFRYLKDQDPNKKYWLALGSNQYVWRKGLFEFKSLRCFKIALEAIDYENREMPYSANGKWKEIYGTRFTV